MSTWYEATTYGVITPKEVERVTESSVFSGGRRFARKASYSTFFETLVEAQNWIIARRHRDIELAEQRLTYASNSLQETLKKFGRV